MRVNRTITIAISVTLLFSIGGFLYVQADTPLHPPAALAFSVTPPPPPPPTSPSLSPVNTAASAIVVDTNVAQMTSAIAQQDAAQIAAEQRRHNLLTLQAQNADLERRIHATANGPEAKPASSLPLNPLPPLPPTSLPTNAPDPAFASARSSAGVARIVSIQGSRNSLSATLVMSDESQQTMNAGEQLPDGSRIKSISPTSVLIVARGRTIPLRFADDPAPAAPPIPPAIPPGPATMPSPVTVQPLRTDR